MKAFLHGLLIMMSLSQAWAITPIDEIKKLREMGHEVAHSPNPSAEASTAYLGAMLRAIGFLYKQEGASLLQLHKILIEARRPLLLANTFLMAKTKSDAFSPADRLVLEALNLYLAGFETAALDLRSSIDSIEMLARDIAKIGFNADTKLGRLTNSESDKTLAQGLVNAMMLVDLALVPLISDLNDMSSKLQPSVEVLHNLSIAENVVDEAKLVFPEMARSMRDLGDKLLATTPTSPFCQFLFNEPFRALN